MRVGLFCKQNREMLLPHCFKVSSKSSRNAIPNSRLTHMHVTQWVQLVLFYFLISQMIIKINKKKTQNKRYYDNSPNWMKKCMQIVGHTSYGKRGTMSCDGLVGNEEYGNDSTHGLFVTVGQTMGKNLVILSAVVNCNSPIVKVDSARWDPSRFNRGPPPVSVQMVSLQAPRMDVHDLLDQDYRQAFGA